jgi:hypothetical protein
MVVYFGFIKRSVLVLVLAIFTYLLCEIPNFHPEEFIGMKYHWWLDMFFHGGYYFAATLLLYGLFCPKEKILLFFIFVLTISFVFEGLQFLAPGRTPSLIDVLSNFMGISFASLVGYAFSNYKIADRRKKWAVKAPVSITDLINNEKS